MGTSEAGACADVANNITRFCNCPIISTGCFVFTGSPINPQVVIGQTNLVNQTDLSIWEINPLTGQIVGPLTNLLGQQLFC